MDNLIDEFRQLKKTIASLSEKKARLEGKKEQKLLELKEKYNIINKEEAEKKLEELVEMVDSHEKRLQELKKELEEIVEKAEK